MDPTRHSLVIYDEDSWSVRLHKLSQALYEEIVEILYDFITRTGRLERALTPSYWREHAAQMVRIEKCLRQRNGLRLRRVATNVNEEDTDADIVLNEEQIKADGERRMAMRVALERAVAHMDAYEALIEQVESLRQELYVKGNEKHEKLLRKLWKLMGREGEELRGVVSPQWRTIGFQGDDPSTDFRGMGVLSLHQMIFFAQFDVEAMLSVLSLSHHPTIGFPFAIAGITFTSLTRALLLNGQLKRHFYNSSTSPPTLDAFHHSYCRIFSLFASFWRIASPPSVMHFNAVRADFEKALSRRLEKDNANLDRTTAEQLFNEL